MDFEYVADERPQEAARPCRAGTFHDPGDCILEALARSSEASGVGVLRKHTAVLSGFRAGRAAQQTSLLGLANSIVSMQAGLCSSSWGLPGSFTPAYRIDGMFVVYVRMECEWWSCRGSCKTSRADRKATKTNAPT